MSSGRRVTPLGGRRELPSPEASPHGTRSRDTGPSDDTHTRLWACARQPGSQGRGGFTSSKGGVETRGKTGSYFEKVWKAGTLKLDPWFLKRHWRQPRPWRGALQRGM